MILCAGPPPGAPWAALQALPRGGISCGEWVKPGEREPVAARHRSPHPLGQCCRQLEIHSHRFPWPGQGCVVVGGPARQPWPTTWVATRNTLCWMPCPCSCAVWLTGSLSPPRTWTPSHWTCCYSSSRLHPLAPTLWLLPSALSPQPPSPCLGPQATAETWRPAQPPLWVGNGVINVACPQHPLSTAQTRSRGPRPAPTSSPASRRPTWTCSHGGLLRDSGCCLRLWPAG